MQFFYNHTNHYFYRYTQILVMNIWNIKKSIKFCKIVLPAYIKARFKTRPVWAHLVVTRKCNLNCKYCFAKDDKKSDLNEEQLRRIIDHLYSLGCRFVSFFGGEPTIKKFFVNLVRYTNQKGIITHLSTNGILLTPVYIDELGKAGIDVINLSIDSLLESYASEKDYIKSREVLNNLIDARKKYGFEINLNLTLTNKNTNSVIGIIKSFNVFEIPISIGLIVANTYDSKALDESLFFKTKEDKTNLYNVLDEIKTLRKRGYNIIDPLQYFDDIRKFVDGTLYDWYCCAGEYYFSVDCDGKFQICAGLPAEEISIFDIDRDYYEKLADIREKRLSQCKKIYILLSTRYIS